MCCHLSCFGVGVAPTLYVCIVCGVCGVDSVGDDLVCGWIID